jgi:uncharacterized protein (TIGR00369 family)
MSIEPDVTNRLDVQRVEALIDARFPQIHAGGRTLLIEEVAARSARVRLKAHDRNIRPGGTVSGPAMFTLADFAVYVAIIGALGEAGIAAVTTNLNINFLAKPEPRDLLASVRLLRIGRRLAVGEVELYSEGVPEMVAHAIATYALPPPADR